MKFKERKIELIDSIDHRNEVWRISRPHIDPNDELANKIDEMDLPLHGFSYYSFKITGSLLLRDVLYHVRPANCWAVSNRTTLINADSLFLSDEYNNDEYINNDYVVECYNKSIDVNVMQDERKKYFLYSVSTTFCWSVDYRTLSNVLRSMTNIPYLRDNYLKLFLDAIGKKSVNELAPGNINLFERLAYYNKVDDTVAVTSNYCDITMNMSGNLLSQFIRQQYTTVKSTLITYLVLDTLPISQCETFTANVILDTDQVRKLVGTRSCWFSHFDLDDYSSWSRLVKKLMDTTGIELKDALLCKCDINKCKWLSEQVARCYAGNPERKGEVNPPCPIITGIPDVVDIRMERIRFNGGEPSKLLVDWSKLVSKLDMTTTEYGKLYIDNLKKYGFVEPMDNANPKLVTIKNKLK